MTDTDSTRTPPAARPLTRRELRDLDVYMRREVIMAVVTFVGLLLAFAATVTPVIVWMVTP